MESFYKKYKNVPKTCDRDKDDNYLYPDRHKYYTALRLYSEKQGLDYVLLKEEHEEDTENVLNGRCQFSKQTKD